MSYDYFYGQSGELFSYFRIPKALFQDHRFRQLSTDARTLYGTKRKYRIAQTAILVLLKAQFWNSQNRKQIRLIRIRQSGTILTLSIPGASGSSLKIIFIRR